MAAEIAGRLHVREFHADGETPGFAVDLGMPCHLGHQICAPKIYGGGTAAVAVIDGFGGAGVNLHAENRHLIALSRRLVRLLLGVLPWSGSILREHRSQENHAQ
ncbi:MAG TPA: hypothetical protein VG099_18465 [Gemmataceae bacterium]|nr:hypothetical protein [Gemmataceae bacterium]